MAEVKIVPVHIVKAYRRHHFKVEFQLHAPVALSLGNNSCTH